MRTKGTIILALATASFATTAADAQTRGGFEVGAELFDYSYREELDGEDIVFDDGIFGGFHASYVETLGSGWFARARLLATTGSVDYRSTGSGLIDPANPDPGPGARLNNVDQQIGQLELTAGRDFPIGGGATLTPFTGFAARVLTDNSGGLETEEGFFGYDREISYGYVPLGLAASVPIGGTSTLLLSAQYNWVVNGKAESKFSKIDPEAPDVKLDLDGGHGLEASALLQLPVGRNAISFGPFIRRWDIDESDSFILLNPEDPTEGLEFFEPKNRTTELGLRVSFAF
jgi:hypothetical protein